MTSIRLGFADLSKDEDLLMEAQRRATGCQEAQARARGQQLSDHRRGGQNVLEIVEHQEHAALAQVVS